MAARPVLRFSHKFALIQFHVGSSVGSWLMRSPILAILAFSIAATNAAPSRAAAISQMLSTQSWSNGAINIGTGNFADPPPPGSGGPPPFDTLIGDKSFGPDPSTSFTFSGYGGPIGGPISSANIEIGLYDASSPDPSKAVSFFTLNGDSIASQLTAALVANPPVRNGEIYYTVDLPNTVFSALATGISTFALGFTGPGEGLLGPSNYILFGLDFATLTITTGTVVPEPSTWAMLLLGFAGLGFAGYRRGRVA